MSETKIESIYPLSPTQHGMFVHTSTAPGTGVYFQQFCWTLLGDVNVKALQESWQQLVDGHPVLRTFVWQRGKDPVQVVLKHVEVPWGNLDWRAVDVTQQEESLARFLALDLKKDFDLSKAPLMRFTLIQISERKYHLIWSWHHLLLDGWSLGIVFKDVGDIYQAILHGRTLNLEPRRPFQNYITWLNERDLSEAEAFWRQELKGFVAPTALGFDNGPKRLSTKESAFSKLETLLPEALSARIQAFARAHRLTLNTILQGAWAILLSRYSGQTDVLFGTVVSGRPSDLAGVEEIVGMFLNALPFRVNVKTNEPLIPWLKDIQSRHARVREFETVPLVQTQGWSDVPRGLPLFESLVVFENFPANDLVMDLGKDLDARQVTSREATNYPLEIVGEPGARLKVRITYDENRFDSSTVSWILEHFQTLFEAIVEYPDRPVSAFPIISRETRRALRPAAAPKGDSPAFIPVKCEEINQSIASRFEQQARKHPGRIAVKTISGEDTYEQLDRRANQIGHAILASGLGKDSRIALLLGHDGRMITALMGALKAGVTYVPLEPRYPKERLDTILQDSAASALLTDQANLRLAESVRPDGMPLIVLENALLEYPADRPPSNPSPDDFAYILYTSGSTGRPKGVVQNNRNVLHFNRVYTNALQIVPDDRLSLFSSYSHDAAVMDIFGALLNGATLCPKDIRQDGLLDFEKWLVDEGITIYHSIPTLFRSVVRTLAEKRHFPKLRLVVLGGEAVFRSDVETFRMTFGPNCRMVNILGPTESTIGSMYFIDADTQINRNLVPIGHEVEETEFLLLDDSGQPTDVYGEIAIRSPYVAMGYWRNPELTQKAFVPDLLGEHRAMYRTGDIARLLPNGSYEFVGRKDFQVKIRGFRIELGDIESTLKGHPAVKDAVVVSRESEAGGLALVAYIVTKSEDSIKSAELREHLEKRLPDYMVPSFYVFLNVLPVTPNGKIDRRALPAPDLQFDDSARKFEAPRNATEEVVAGIWSEVLGRTPIGAYDNFFALGGHSLLATQVLSRLRETLQVDVPLRILFESPTVADFAQIVLQDAKTRPQIEKRAHMIVKISSLSDDELNSMVKEKGLRPN